MAKSANDITAAAVESLSAKQAKAEHARLHAELSEHDKRYYQDDKPIVTDAEYAQSPRHHEIQAVAALVLTHQDRAARQRLPSDLVGEEAQRRDVDDAKRIGERADERIAIGAQPAGPGPPQTILERFAQRCAD